MPEHYLLQKKIIEDLSLVIQDKKEEFGLLSKISLKNTGKIVYDFVMDVHEIGKYCFPIDIYKIAYLPNEFEEIIDSQIAYNDVFKLHHSRPIIFKEYEEELEGTFDYFRSFHENVRHKTNSQLLKALWTHYINISNKTDDDSKFKDFAVALSLAYFSSGVERLTEIYPKRLVFESRYEKDDLLNHLINYKPNPSKIDFIYKKVAKKIRWKNELALKRDIASIEKVFFLNNFFIENNINRRLIYFSSATVLTKNILSVFKQSIGTEKSNYYDFNPWRTPIQIYLYLILRELDEKNEYIKTNETIKNLEGLKSQINDLIEFEKKIINNKFSNLEQESEKIIKETLSIKRENYIEKLETIEGLKLDSIAFLSGIRKNENKEKIESNIDSYSPELKTEIMSFLLSTINFTSQNIDYENDIENLRIQLQTDMKLSDIIPIDFANNDDIITNCYDAYPFLLYLENDYFKKILDSLFDYWIDFYQKIQFKKTNTFVKYKILEIINNFLSLDNELTIQEQDYYTVSAMVHLVNPNKSSDSIANNYIKKLEDFDKVEENKNLLYIKATILRRRGNYVESIELCDKYKIEDFRFAYCRALALIGLVAEKKARFYQNKDKIEEAIIDLKVVFDKLERSSFEHKNSFQAAICSNIVYLSALYFHHMEDEKHLHLPSKSSFVETSEEYLLKLKDLQPKDKWENLYPDYYHSEAFLEYSTIKAFIDDHKSDNFSIQPKESWEARLASALRDINKAIKFSTVKKKTLFYEELKENLEKMKGKL